MARLGAATPFNLDCLRKQYDAALQYLSDPSTSGVSSPTQSERVHRELESLLLCGILLLKANEIKTVLTEDQRSTIHETMSQCEIMLEVVEQKYASNKNATILRSVDMPKIHVQSLGKGHYMWNLDTEIDLSNIQLDEEESDLIAMANTPTPFEDDGSQSQDAPSHTESTDVDFRNRLQTIKALLGNEENEAAESQCRRKKSRHE
ncbi:hypothetical protein ACA910_018120 [Epithemia clementina (nom. ined.)]